MYLSVISHAAVRYQLPDLAPTQNLDKIVKISESDLLNLCVRFNRNSILRTTRDNSTFDKINNVLGQNLESGSVFFK